MGCPIQSNPPTILSAGITYAVGGFKQQTMIGLQYASGVFVAGASGYDNYNCPALYINEGDFTADVVKKGGIAPFMTWLVDGINTVFASHGIPAVFTIPAATVPEPHTDDECLAVVQAIINTGKFSGHEIPAKLRADFDAYWSPAVPVGNSMTFANGSITKLAVCLAIYADPTGALMAIPPNADLNALARNNANIAAAWKAEYNFTPA